MGDLRRLGARTPRLHPDLRDHSDKPVLADVYITSYIYVLPRVPTIIALFGETAKLKPQVAAHREAYMRLS